MADTGVQTATGTGEYLLDGGHLIAALAFWLDSTTPDVDFLSTLRPRRVMHAGWIALASGTTGVAAGDLALSDFEVSWFSYFDHESNMRVNPSANAFDDRIMWALPAGVVAKFQAYW